MFVLVSVHSFVCQSSAPHPGAGVTTSLALGGLIPLGLYLRLHRQTRHVAYLEHGAAWLPSPGVARLALGLTGGASVLFAIPLLL